MPKQTYNWRRYWCRLGSRVSLGLSGFLEDPQGDFGFSNAHLKTLTSLTEKHCLILLGEPGIGKSKTLELERSQLDSSTAVLGDSIWVDLRVVGSRQDLDAELFNQGKFTDWLEGERNLYVYLDSLDECLTRAEYIVRYLSKKLGELDSRCFERLYLRIACRTADWQLLKMGAEIGSLWNKESQAQKDKYAESDEYVVYELVTLRREDIEIAAELDNLDAEQFVNQIIQMGLVSLASKPMTMTMLIDLFAKGRLRSDLTKREIYRDGCERLAEEARDGIRRSTMGTSLDAVQRIAICQRVAALMILGDKGLITLDSFANDLPEGSYRTSDFSGGIEGVAGNELEITEGKIEEVLKTGLFSARSENALGWAHQSYSEYLSAEWLNRCLSLVQIKSLLFHKEPTGYKSIPRLREISVWLAAINEEVLGLVEEFDPELLLNCDPAVLSDEVKLRLASNILNKFISGVLSDHDLHDLPHTDNLACAGLDNILRPILSDKVLPKVARRCAIYMGFHCKVQSVQDQIADIILDPNEEHDLRQSAGLYMSEVADTNCQRRLKVIWPPKGDDDEGNRLAHWLMRALWPANMTSEELFQDDAIRTIDKMWDYKAILNGLRPTDLPLALEWVSRQGSRHQLGYTLDKFLNGIMIMGWEYIKESGVAVPFARAAFSRLQHHDDIIQEEDRKVSNADLFQDSHKVRILLAKIVSLVDERRMKPWDVQMHQFKLGLERDFDWLIETIQTCVNPAERAIWAYIIRVITNQSAELPSKIADTIVSRSQYIPELEQEFELPSIQLDCEKAINQKKYFYDAQQWQNRPEPKPPSLPSLVAPIPYFLSEFEKGDLRGWTATVSQLTAKINGSQAFVNWSETDLTSGPIWTALDQPIKDRIISVAKVYLEKGEPHNDEWLADGEDLRAIAGFQALNILLSEEPSFLDSIKPDIWRKWAAVILTFDGGSKLELRSLIQLAYKNAPEEILKALAARLRGSGNHAYSLFNGQLQSVWDDDVSRSLLELVTAELPTPWGDELVLEELMDRYGEDTLQWLRSRITAYEPGDDKRDRVIIYVRVLVNKARDAAWDLVWQLIQRDLETGKAIAFTLASRRHQDESPLLQKLSSLQLAHLYIWVETNFSHNEDPFHTSAYSPGPRDDIASWRASIIRKLENIGAFEEIDRINQVFKQEWLAATSRRASQRFRDLNWNPVDPRSLLQMARDNKARIVTSSEHLLSVVLESLQRYEAHLQHNGAWRDIWNLSKGKWTPHIEDEFSDHIKRFLDTDLMQKGVIINREVRINAVGREHDRTDLQIDAVTVDSRGQDVHKITLIVEVKKSSSLEIPTAMSAQLVDRYLKGKGLNHGIFLVGWFGAEESSKKMTIKEIYVNVNAESTRLSTDGYKVEAIVVNAMRRLGKKEPRSEND